MCPIVNYVLVSLCNIVMIEDDRKLASSWCQIGFLNDQCLSSLISLRNGSVLDTNIWFSIFKWIRNEDSKFIIHCAVEQTLQHSLIPLFFGTLCRKINDNKCSLSKGSILFCLFWGGDFGRKFFRLNLSCQKEKYFFPPYVGGLGVAELGKNYV